MGVQFSQDLTEEEAAVGFQLQEIDNPEGQSITPPVRLRAVVFQVDDSQRLVKVHDAQTGQVSYRRQVHGIWNPPVAGDLPTWKVCGEHTDARLAVSAEARQADLSRSGPSIVPSPPAFSRDHGT